MKTKNPMQLKAFIKKKSAEKNISPQLVMQNYMMERLLERISVSEYRNNFIIKGGFLISSIVGLDTRATMDLDTTVKGIPLSKKRVQEIFSEICSIALDDDVEFVLSNVSDIRKGAEYPGVRVFLSANYLPISVPLTVDITTGDIIIPSEIEYSYSLMFEERSISVLSYNLETILAEKLETVLSRNIANTRPRDFYDIYILYSFHASEINEETLFQSLKLNAIKRGSNLQLENYSDIIQKIKESTDLQNFWEKYQRTFDYAKSISYLDTCNMIEKILNKISKGK